MTTDLNDLMSQIPMDQLARQLGVDEQTAEQATREALPALLGGMQANAQDPPEPPHWAALSGSTTPA